MRSRVVAQRSWQARTGYGHLNRSLRAGSDESGSVGCETMRRASLRPDAARSQPRGSRLMSLSKVTEIGLIICTVYSVVCPCAQPQGARPLRHRGRTGYCARCGRVTFIFRRKIRLLAVVTIMLRRLRSVTRLGSRRCLHFSTYYYYRIPTRDFCPRASTECVMQLYISSRTMGCWRS